MDSNIIIAAVAVVNVIVVIVLVRITANYAKSTEGMLKEMRQQRRSSEEELEVIKRNLWISTKAAQVSAHAALTGSGTPEVRKAAFKRLNEQLVPELDDLERDSPSLAKHSKITGQQPDV